MKFGQLIESNIRSIFTQKSCRKWEKRTSSRLLFVIKKSSICGKSNWSGAWFQYFLIALNLTYNKNKLYKTVDYWLRDIIAFGFLEKGLRIVFAPHVVYDVSGKMLLMLYSINWSNIIVFTSWDIEQYVYCNFLFPRLWNLRLSNQTVFLHDQKSKTKN